MKSTSGESGSQVRVARGRRPAAQAGDMRLTIIEAALESLKTDGYAGTSIRSIARRGGFNSALISYYFGGLHGLLLAVLDHNSERRRRAYSEAAEEAKSLPELARVASRIYRQDLDEGNITVFSELVAASLTHKELGPDLVKRAGPWLEMVEATISRFTEGTPFEDLLPARDLAFAAVAFYVGVNVLAHLDDDRSRTDSLFALAESLAPMVAVLLGESPVGATQSQANRNDDGT